MNHHDGSGQKLNAPNEISERIIPQCKPKRAESKCYAINQQYLKCTEQSVQQSRANVNSPPAPLDEEFLVRHDT